MKEYVGALEDAGVDAAFPEDVAVAPNLKAGVLELKLGAADESLALAVVTRVGMDRVSMRDLA